MNAKTEKDAAGKALYLEFRKDVYTYQMVMVPDIIALDGQDLTGAAVMSRRTSVWHPRRNWGFSSTRKASTLLMRDPVSGFVQTDADFAKSFASETIDSLALLTTMNQLFHRGWTLFRAPLVVEFSYKDMEMIRSAKTPTDLIRRIQRSREAAGWGESLHNAVAAPATPVSPAI